MRDHLLDQLNETRENLNQVMLDAIRLAQQVVMPRRPAAAWNM